MVIEDIKISDDTIFAVDWQKLVSWNLNYNYESRKETKVHLITPSNLECLRLSHDCSQIVYIGGNIVCVYNVQVQTTLECFHSDL